VHFTDKSTKLYTVPFAEKITRFPKINVKLMPE